MMYCEFVDGTGCKETEYNYGVYKNLEIMYMNSDLTKEQIYEYGRKLVDNSETEEEKAVRIEIEGQIAQIKSDIENDKFMVENHKAGIEVWKGVDKDMERMERSGLRWWSNQLKADRQRLATMKQWFPDYFH